MNIPISPLYTDEPYILFIITAIAALWLKLVQRLPFLNKMRGYEKNTLLCNRIWKFRNIIEYEILIEDAKINKYYVVITGCRM
jgi:hypothetical protein